MRCARARLLAGAGLVVFGLSAGAEQAFVWADRPGAALYAPNARYSHNPRGGVSIRRDAPGNYAVMLEGFAGGRTHGGNVVVTAYGRDSSTCKVARWVPQDEALQVNVACFEAGRPADARFSLLATFADAAPTPDTTLAFVWGNRADTESYAPQARYAYNPTGGDISAVRRSVGRYSVRFQGLNRGREPGGNVQVTGYGPGSETCKVERWIPRGADLEVDVVCHDASGRPADARWTALVILP